MLSPRVTDRRPFALALGSLIVLAWAALSVWGASPYGRYLLHDSLAQVQIEGFADYLPMMLLFVGGWTIMTIAMMLPTSLPLMLLFQRLMRDRVDAVRLVTLLLAGYLTIWMLFGVVVHVADLGLHQIVRLLGLGGSIWILGVVPLLVAGGYQFTRLKYLCLDRCRSPLSFITEHWHGERENVAAFRLGIAHGLYCLGCCWSLMLLMFAQGIGNVGWMLVLGAVMSIEKNMPWGRRISTPLGVGLLTAGAVLLLQHTLVP